MTRDKPGKQRSTILLACFFLLAVIIAGRSGFIQLMDSEYFEEMFVEKSFTKEERVPARRGMFLDRNGSPIAASAPLYLVAVDPKQMGVLIRRQLEKEGEIAEAQLDAKTKQRSLARIQEVAKVYDLDPSELTAKFEDYYDRDRQYLVITKDATSTQVRDTLEHIPKYALIQNPRYQRQYPDGRVIGGVVGFTHKDNSGAEIMEERGAAGLEKMYESTLRGVPRRVKMIMARDGESLEELEVLEERQNGTDIQLSLDRRVQYFAYKALKDGIDRFEAEGGSVIVMKPDTGEILAMVNLPTFDPNNINMDEFRNRDNFSLVTPIEPGSTIKPIMMSLAVERGVVNRNTQIDTNNGVLRVGRFTITDVSRRDILTASEVIKYSSNVGASKIAAMMGAPALHGWYEQVGFGDKTALKYPGESNGFLRPADEWRESGLYTHSYGYGMQVTLMQLLKAYTAIANDGRLVEPTMRKVTGGVDDKRVLSERSAREVRAMMKSVVESEGASGRRAKVSGFDVAGKTGTAHVVKNGQYQEGTYRSLFVGMLPQEAPELLTVVMVNEPKAVDENGERLRFGSQVAAPIFSEIMENAVRVLGIQPTKHESRLAQREEE